MDDLHNATSGATLAATTNATAVSNTVDCARRCDSKKLFQFLRFGSLKRMRAWIRTNLVSSSASECGCPQQHGRYGLPVER